MEHYNFQELIKHGVYYLDEDGDFQLDMVAAEKYAPALYWANLNELDMAILQAVDDGYLRLEITTDENGEPSKYYVLTGKDIQQ